MKGAVARLLQNAYRAFATTDADVLRERVEGGERRELGWQAVREVRIHDGDTCPATRSTQVFADAKADESRAFTLPAAARLRNVSRHVEVQSPNIIGMLPGSDPALRNEYVVYTAHLDHLGNCPPVNGDDVCHGAVDNASGVAALLEIARAFASLPRAPRRSRRSTRSLMAITKAWLATVYHTPEDDMDQAFDFAAAAKGARLEFVRSIAASRQDEAKPSTAALGHTR